jgi:hypothetical protein
MPMPNLRNATPAQRLRAIAAFLIAVVIVVIVVAIVR